MLTVLQAGYHGISTFRDIYGVKELDSYANHRPSDKSIGMYDYFFVKNRTTRNLMVLKVFFFFVFFANMAQADIIKSGTPYMVTSHGMHMHTTQQCMRMHTTVRALVLKGH